MRALLAILLCLWAGLADAQSGRRVALLSAGVPAKAAAFYARLSKQPSATKTAQYNALFNCASAQIAKLDALYIFSTNAASGVQADSQTIAFTNLISSSFGITKQGSGSFAQGVGYQAGGAVTDYLDTGFVPSTAGGKYTLNSASMGVVVNNNRTVNQTWAEIGTSVSTTGFDYIIPLWSDGTSFGSIAQATSNPSTTIGATQGTWGITRTASNLTTLYLNGASIATNPQASVALAAFSVVIGAKRGNAGVVGNNSQDIIAAAYFGGGLTGTDEATISTCLAPITTQTMPFQAALNGFGTNVLNETFADGLAGIDVNNTKGAGFRWYVAPFFTSNVAAAVPAASDFTYSGGNLNIKASTNASTYRARIHRRGNTSSYSQGTISGTTWTVNSMAPGSNPIAAGQVLAGANITANSIVQPFGTSGTTGVGGTGTYALSQSSTVGVAQSIVGQSNVGAAPLITAGGYFECTVSYNPGLTTGSQTGGWPACWMQDIGGLYSQNATSTYGTALEFLELDFFEAFPSGVTTVSPLIQMHDWTNTSGGGFGTNNQQSVANSVTQSAIMHTYGTVWRTTSINGGTGLIQRFQDGIPVTANQTYFTGSGASPAATPSNPNGVFSIGESGNFDFMLEGGFEMGIAVKSVNVWQ